MNLNYKSFTTDGFVESNFFFFFLGGGGGYKFRLVKIFLKHT